MANATFQTIPTGSQFSQQIVAANGDPEDQNDFQVLISFNENVTGLTLDDFTLTTVLESGRNADRSSRSSILTLTGENSVYLLTLRPPAPLTNRIYWDGNNIGGSMIMTLTLRANAVDQGNPVARTTIRVSLRFPDADAETPTRLFSHSNTNRKGITVTPNEIVVAYITGFSTKFHRRSHTGTFLGTRDVGREYGEGLDYINGDYLLRGRNNVGVKRLRGSDLSEVRGYNFGQETTTFVHTRLGILLAGVRARSAFLVQPYDSLDSLSAQPSVYSRLAQSGSVAHQDDLLYTQAHLYEITEDAEISHVKELNIGLSTRHRAIYGDRWFGLTASEVHFLDIRKYRPVARNTKTTIYPVFATAGDTIDLKQFSPDAERIVFDVGYNKPSFLSINGRNELVTTAAAETCVVKLKAINRIDATETGSFGFYLIIRQVSVAPVWRDVSELTMRAGSRYDLFQLVPDADAIEFRTGRTRLAGSKLSNGIFTVGSVGGVVYFTARTGNSVSHIEITIHVVPGIGVGNPADVSGYRIEIAGIDVTSDSVGFPSVSETLDPVVINEYRVNEASIVLRNEKGKYNSEIANNFWDMHRLNPGGFQNSVNIWTQHSDGTERLLFLGVVNESFESISEATFRVNCVDISSRLRKALVRDFGTLQKLDALRKASDEDSYEGTYVPEASLVPMQVGTGRARSDRTDLNISQLALPSEGPAPENTGYMTPTSFLTAGGFMETNPLLQFKTEHQSEDVRFLINQLAINKKVYNTEIDIPGVEVTEPFLLNRGSVAFSVEPTRTTRVPVDWVHDPTNGRLLILLSNVEQHISDLLVQYDIQTDAYRVLHTFAKGVAVHRIERRAAPNYYILISDGISQDGSKPTQQKTSHSTAFTWDSAAHGSNIRIQHYNTETRTLTDAVRRNNTFPPQLGIHYSVGFENSIYVDEFEGITPFYRGAFKWVGSHLYYRYAKTAEFGVARVNASGTTERLLRETNVSRWNHLNFAFDVTSTGTVYFVKARGGATGSRLIIERRVSDGTVTTVLNDNKALSALRILDADGGAYLGCYEALFHNNFLYMLVPIQRVDRDDSTTPVTYSRSRSKAAGMVLYRCNVTAANPTLTRIDKWDFVSRAGCNLTVHAGRVHFSEHSPALNRFKPINPDL